jgi:sensor histidine kinase regulating citrate/malate metabolism
MQTLQDLSKTLEQFQSFKNLKIETQILQSEDFYNELLEYITAQYKAKNISFTLDPKSTKTFATSKYLSKLILSKLIENSLEAIEEKRIANGTITILLQSDADKSLMQISDNGGGVSENNITKIFDPYFSTKSLNARGLGLHMVKNYVQNALDGTIECNNKHDGFSCTITVPNKR